MLVCNFSDLTIRNTSVDVVIPNTLEKITLTAVNNWILISQRIDSTLSFNRTWAQYKAGFGSFGNASSNFWLGNERIHLMTEWNSYDSTTAAAATAAASYRLRVEFQHDDTDRWYSAEYDSFYVAGESEGYALHVAGFSGDGGDSLIAKNGANGMKFSTWDADNDMSNSSNCALSYSTGWWLNACSKANLNGLYNGGMNWWTLIYLQIESNPRLKVARMMIKKTA